VGAAAPTVPTAAADPADAGPTAIPVTQQPKIRWYKSHKWIVVPCVSRRLCNCTAHCQLYLHKHQHAAILQPQNGLCVIFLHSERFYVQRALSGFQLQLEGFVSFCAARSCLYAHLRHLAQPINAIHSIHVGSVNLAFTPDTAWGPATTSDNVHATLSMCKVCVAHRGGGDVLRL
jgi:hypothetical protein